MEDTKQTTKTCIKCGEEKSYDQFVKSKKCRNGVSNTCKCCENLRQREYARVARETDENYVENRQISQEKDRAKRYGLTLDQLENMKRVSKGLCEICGSPPSNRGTASKSLHVDHCHSTGQVRGMLCSKCNMILGQINESPQRLLEMLVYLHKYKEAQKNV